MQELPKYHETFIPILRVLSDGKVINTNKLRLLVRDTFYKELPEELLNEKTKYGDPLILNRIGFGKAYLKMAKMVQQPERAMVQITDKGRSVLKKGSLTLSELQADEDFIAHKLSTTSAKDSVRGITEKSDATPQELIESGVESLEVQTKSDLLERLKTVDPYYFERVILQLFEKMGYGDFKETSKSGDGGIDGIINQDQLGVEKIYTQAKRYNDHKVREMEIRNFIGAMSGGTSKGIFVTTSEFDENAVKKARESHNNTIILIDGSQLVELMYKHNVGVQLKNTYEVKELDEDFFESD